MYSNPQTYQSIDTGLTPRSLTGANYPFPKFDKPEAKGYFSVNTDRDYEPNAEQLQYYKPPQRHQFPLDLNRGLGLSIKKPVSDEPFESLLKFIYDNLESLLKPKASERDPSVLCAEFVSWRGLFRLIMCTPYERSQDWCIHVTRYKNTFYLRQRETQQAKQRRESETLEQQNMCAWGFKFEQYCLADSPFATPTTNKPVDECAEFTCVFKTKIFGEIEMLYGAEMDGIVNMEPVSLDKNGKLEDCKFIELKLRQENLNDRQQNTFNRFKTLNWWCQSYLVGIEDIYVGLRNEEGLVQNIDRINVSSLPRIGSQFWSASACVHFLVLFLSCLHSTMGNVNCPHTVYQFYFHAASSRITYDVLNGKTPHSFLPDWYIACMDREFK